MSKLRIATIIILGLVSVGPAVAADYADETLPVGLAVWPPLFLGHFSGGRIYPIGDAEKPFVVDWRDEYVRFESYGACRAWLANMPRAYSRLEGLKTCLRLR